jgi:hypothetical protein
MLRETASDFVVAARWTGKAAKRCQEKVVPFLEICGIMMVNMARRYR